jgi:hypothetical protein
VPERSYVTLKIYDLTGKEVAVLVDDVQFAGDYKILFRVPGNCELRTANCKAMYIAALTIKSTHSSALQVSFAKILQH